MGSPASKADKQANWRMMFRQFAENHDYPPQVVKGWTYYQCRMMLCDEKEMTGKVKMSRAELDRLKARGPFKRKMLRRFLGGKG